MWQGTMFGLIFLSFLLVVTPVARANTTTSSPVDGINGAGGVLVAYQSAPPVDGGDDSEISNDDSQGGGGCGGGGG